MNLRYLIEDHGAANGGHDQSTDHTDNNPVRDIPSIECPSETDGHSFAPTFEQLPSLIEQSTKMANPQSMRCPSSKWPAQKDHCPKEKEKATDNKEKGSDSDPESTPTKLEIERAIKTLGSDLKITTHPPNAPETSRGVGDNEGDVNGTYLRDADTAASTLMPQHTPDMHHASPPPPS